MVPDISLHPRHIVYEDPPNQLSVSDVVALAAAGVTMTYAEIKHSVRPDRNFAPAVEKRESLADPIRERWRRANKHKQDRYYSAEGPYSAVQLTAVEYGEDVYVFIATGNGEPQVLKDKGCLYPSDALMAQIHLLVEAQK